MKIQCCRRSRIRKTSVLVPALSPLKRRQSLSDDKADPSVVLPCTDRLLIVVGNRDDGWPPRQFRIELPQAR